MLFDERKKIQAVLFDFDGLLADSETAMDKAYERVCGRLGFQVSRDFLLKARGVTVPVAEKLFDEMYGEIIPYRELRPMLNEDVMSRYRTEGLDRMPGALEILEYCEREGIPTALCTSSQRPPTIEKLRCAGIGEHLFQALVTGDDVTRSKPDPEIFLLGAERIGARPETTLVLEDSLNGVRAGLAGGFIVGMVPDAVQPDEELRAAVDYVFESLHDAREAIRASRE